DESFDYNEISYGDESTDYIGIGSVNFKCVLVDVMAHGRESCVTRGYNLDLRFKLAPVCTCVTCWHRPFTGSSQKLERVIHRCIVWHRASQVGTGTIGGSQDGTVVRAQGQVTHFTDGRAKHPNFPKAPRSLQGKLWKILLFFFIFFNPFWGNSTIVVRPVEKFVKKIDDC
ncbi:hypothetical protein HAX54_032692, partial [Datura stramonium]|nr:hypothetical protein [Datura stramonium]